MGEVGEVHWRACHRRVGGRVGSWWWWTGRPDTHTRELHRHARWQPGRRPRFLMRANCTTNCTTNARPADARAGIPASLLLRRKRVTQPRRR